MLRSTTKILPTKNFMLYENFDKNRSKLLRYLKVRINDPFEAEDILQDLWIKLATLTNIEVREPLAYLYRIAENLVLDRRRSALRQSKRDYVWIELHIEGSLSAPIEPTASAERNLLALEALRHTDDQLTSLSDRARRILYAVRVEGAPQRDVAQQFGISLSAVEKDLSKAYRKIAQIKAQCFSDYEYELAA